MNILTIPQVQAFLATIRERPFDTSARLVYADWLEDNGHAKAARRQREYARMIETRTETVVFTTNVSSFRINNGIWWHAIPDGTLRMQSPAGKKQRRVTRMSAARMVRLAHSKGKQRNYAAELQERELFGF